MAGALDASVYGIPGESRGQRLAAGIHDFGRNVEVERALEVLQGDFVEPDAIGLVGAWLASSTRPAEEIQAGVAGLIETCSDCCENTEKGPPDRMGGLSHSLLLRHEAYVPG